MHESMALCVASSYKYLLDYTRATLTTRMKTEGFQKTGGFELCSEATLLVSMPDFIDKNYTKQKAQEISTLII